MLSGIDIGRNVRRPKIRSRFVPSEKGLPGIYRPFGPQINMEVCRERADRVKLFTDLYAFK